MAGCGEARASGYRDNLHGNYISQSCSRHVKFGPVVYESIEKSTIKITRGNSVRPVGKPAKPNGAEGAKCEARPGGHTDPDKEEPEGIDKIMAKLTSMEINFIEIRRDLREGFQTTDFKIAELDDKVKAAKTICEE